MEVAKIVFLIIDIVFFLVLALKLFIGFIKGWRKTLLNTIAFVVPFILLVIFLGPIARKLVLAPFLSEASPLENILNMLGENAEYVSLPATTEILIGLLAGIAKVALYIAGLIICFIFSIIIKIIFSVALGGFIKNGYTDGKKKLPMRSRLIGMGIAALAFSVTFMIWFMPFAGVMNIADIGISDAKVILEKIDVEEQRLSEGSDIIDILTDVQKAVNESAVYNISKLGQSSKTGLTPSSKYLGSVMKVKANGYELSLLDEYGNLRRLIPIVSKIIKNNELDFNLLDEKDIEIIADCIKEMGLINFVVPALEESLQEYVDETEYLTDDVKAKLKKVKVKDEIDIVIDSVVDLIIDLKGITIDTENPLNMAREECVPNAVEKFLTSLLKSEILTNVFIPEFVKEVRKNIPEEYSDVKEIITKDTIISFIKHDIKEIIAIFMELDAKTNIADFAMNDETFKISEGGYDVVGDALTRLLSLTFIQGNEDVLIKLALDQTNDENLSYDVLFSGVSANWEQEKENLGNILKEALKLYFEHINGKELDITLFIAQENNKYVIEPLIDTIIESDLLIHVAYNFLEANYFDTLEQELQDVLTLDAVEECVKNDIKTLLNIIHTIDENSNIIDVLFKDAKKIELKTTDTAPIKDAITSLFSISLIEGNEEVLMKFILNKIGKEEFSYEVLFKDLDVNWANEKENIGDIITEAIKLYINEIEGNEIDIALLTKKENGTYIIEPLLQKVASSDLLVGVMINYLKANSETLLKDVPSDLKEIINFETLENIKGTFYQDIKNILDIFDLLVSMNVLFASEGATPDFSCENIEKLIDLVFASNIIKGKESQIINYILNLTNLNDTLSTYGITLNLEDVNWEEEKTNLKNVFTALFAFGNIEDIDFAKMMEERTEETKTNLATLLQALDDSQIFSSALYPLLNTMILEVGYDVTFDEEDKAQIRINGWIKEVDVVFSIIDTCKTTLNSAEDYTSVSGSVVSSIMLDASESVIASKIIGTVLNTMLGPDHLDIMPTNPDNTPKYDFTDPQTLKNVASEIGALIDLVNNVSMFDATNPSSNDEVIETVTTTLATLGSSELVKDVIGEYTDVTFLENEELDLASDAQTIQNVYDAYSANPETFDITEHPTLQQELENSDVASAILGLLGIL